MTMPAERTNGAPRKPVEIVYQRNPMQVILYTDPLGALWCTAIARDAMTALTLADARMFAQGLLTAIDQEIAAAEHGLERRP